MLQRRRLIQTFSLLVVGGSFVPGCSGGGNQKQLAPPPKIIASTSPKPQRKVPLPKYINPNASNRDLKGDYAD